MLFPKQVVVVPVGFRSDVFPESYPNKANQSLTRKFVEIGAWYEVIRIIFIILYRYKKLQYMLHLRSTILLITLQQYNTTGTGPQGARDNYCPVAINIKTCKKN